jgi:hypothetical protein
MIAGISVAVVVLGVGGYFGVGFLTKAQTSANEKRRQVEKNSDGGEMGHIANLYDFLDATEPGGRGLGGMKNRGSAPRQRSAGAARPVTVAGDDEDEMTSRVKAAPVVPATYTLEVDKSTVPTGRVNGMIAGTNFLADVVQVDTSGTTQVLRLIQGSSLSPDREILIYIQLKSGGTIAGHSWKVSKDTKGTEVTQVAKRWKSNPRMAPEMKSFSTGFALQLEIGQPKNGEIPGKVFVALPDKEQTVAGGVFTIEPNFRRMMQLGDEL